MRAVPAGYERRQCCCYHWLWATAVLLLLNCKPANQTEVRRECNAHGETGLNRSLFGKICHRLLVRNLTEALVELPDGVEHRGCRQTNHLICEPFEVGDRPR